MAELLYPIAISSELDVSGEERIHAAKTSIITRPPYVPVPPAMFAAMYTTGGTTAVHSICEF